jgi:hypothetical protein
MARKAVVPLSGIKFSTRTLRALAYEHLRYETGGCMLVCFERSPYGSKPDVLGLDKRRFLHEIEIKISKADFDRDAKKPHRIKLMQNLERAYPREHNYLSYLVPPELVNHVLANAPEYAGVMTPNSVKLNSFTGFPTINVLRKPLKLHDNRLSIRNSIYMIRDMAGSMASLLRDDVRHQTRRAELEEQITELGGVVKKTKRKTRKPTKKLLNELKKAKKKKAKAEKLGEEMTNKDIVRRNRKSKVKPKTKKRLKKAGRQ